MPNLLRVLRLFFLSSLDSLMGRIVNFVLIIPNLPT
jgi:hypothetical protein